MIVFRTDLQFADDPDGRWSPVSSGWRPDFCFNNEEFDCKVKFPNDLTVYPGDWVLAIITLPKLSSDLLYLQLGPGEQFTLRDEYKTVATGVITAMLDDDSPKAN
ncbi:MAG TPA: hypothetical protein VGI40_19255 [Pirellulaceae bacterium]|jgi:translation elongation factor EF-Tu-like GTPase